MNRYFDILIAIVSLFILLPLIIFVSIMIKVDSKGPIFFISERIGQYNQKFKMIKFRTMFIDTEIVETDKLKNPDIKITRFGKIIRRYSIDEIPQLICVIFGKMAIVGPRPALPEQTDLIKARINLEIDKIKPGITGYAQINGRDFISIEKKIALESEYMSKKNFIFDLLIIFKTFKVVFKKKGVSH